MKKDITRKFIFHIVVWIVSLDFYTLLSRLIVQDSSIGLGNDGVIVFYFFVQTSGVAIGVFMAGIDLLMDNYSRKNRSFGATILFRSFLPILVIFVIHGLFLITVIINYDRDLGKFVSVLIYSCVIVLISNFMIQVSKKFGPEMMWFMITGKYFNPIEENRIFMFLELKSSAVYAEKLGHIRFSKMLQDCFYDLNAILFQYRAEIDHYIGDEAVLTWKVNTPIHNANCLRLFFAFQDELQSRSKHYLKNYGFVPEFKAGVNAGNVTVVEVGDIKRSIAFHGDVLNTAARIQAQCNRVGISLMISKDLENILDLPENFSKEAIGLIALEGKEHKVPVYGIERRT